MKDIKIIEKFRNCDMEEAIKKLLNEDGRWKLIGPVQTSWDSNEAGSVFVATLIIE